MPFKLIAILPTRLLRFPRMISNIEVSENSRGMTLVELLIGLGLSSVVVLAAFSVFQGGLNFAGVYNRSFGATESIEEGVQLLNAYMPMVTEVKSCLCTGTSSTGVDSCTYNSSTDPWDVGGNAKAATTLLDVEFESHYLKWVAGSGVANTATAYITGNSLSGKYGCGTNSYAATSRGCKWRMQLKGMPPVKESGATASTPGWLKLQISSSSDTSVYTEHWIGKSTDKMGITYVACGFLTPQSGQQAPIFVLDFKVKVKSTTIENTSSALYEGFDPTSQNYARGFFKNQHLQFTFANIGTRGVYSWRTRGYAGCKANGSTVQDSIQCCSTCRTAAGACQDCIRSGQAATEATRCYSQQLNGGGTACL